MASIAQIVECFAYGAAKSVCQLCDLLPPEDRVTVYHGYRQGSEVDLRSLSDRVTWKALPGSGPLRHLQNLRYLDGQLRQGFDIVHGHSSYGGFYAKLIGRKHGLRTLYSPRGYAFLREDYSPTLRSIFRTIERFTSKSCVSVCCGPYEKRLADELGGEAVCINNGYHITTPVPVDQLNRMVLGVGRICPQKGFDVFVSVAERLPEISFTWVGQRDDGLPLPENLPKNLTVLPCIEHAEMLAMIAPAYLVFLPSRWEGLSRFLIESACMGKAIVTSRFPGNMDCLAGEERNTWFDNGAACYDVEQYVHAIAHLFSHPERVDQMQWSSHELAKAQFDIQSITRQWRDIYQLPEDNPPVSAQEGSWSVHPQA